MRSALNRAAAPGIALSAVRNPCTGTYELEAYPLTGPTIVALSAVRNPCTGTYELEAYPLTGPTIVLSPSVLMSIPLLRPRSSSAAGAHTRGWDYHPPSSGFDRCGIPALGSQHLRRGSHGPPANFEFAQGPLSALASGRAGRVSANAARVPWGRGHLAPRGRASPAVTKRPGTVRRARPGLYTSSQVAHRLATRHTGSL